MKPLYWRVLRNLGQPITLLSWALYQVSRGNNYRFVTMPCSGTHWLRFMIARSLVKYFDLDYQFTDLKVRELVPRFRRKMDRFAYNDRTEIPRIQHSHDFYSPLYWRNRVVFLVRDLRDSLVSHYDRYSSWDAPELTFGEFLREQNVDTTRTQSLSWRVRFLNSWERGRRRVSKFLTVRYEDLKEDPVAELESVLDFLSLGDLDEDFLTSVVDFSSRENMRRIERESVSEQKGTPKVNKAETNRHGSYFDDSDERYFREYLAEHLNDDFGYDYGTSSDYA